MIVIQSVEALAKLFTKYSSGYLFRGQVKHYEDESGKVGITTSFHRHGCIPPLMQKWDFYCREVLLAHKGPDWNEGITLTECQAALQHYGWRSFFVDFSNNPMVASWFASHCYRESSALDAVEDWAENGIMCVHKSAEYSEIQGFGYLYIADKEQIRSTGVEISELERFRFSDFESRFDRQDAVIVGPLAGGILPESVIVEIIKAPISVLLEYSRQLSQQHLFPDRNTDKIYQLLLAAPFVLIQDKSLLYGIGLYVREIDIPEYDYEYCNRPAPKTVFYQQRYIIDQTNKMGDKSKIIRVSDDFLYHTDLNLDNSIVAVEHLLGQDERLIIETDGLLKLPVDFGDDKCLKGAVVERVNERIISVSGLVVRHPGAVCLEIGLDMGWHYEISEGKFQRISRENDCPCNNHRKHTLEMSIVRKLEEAISKGLVEINKDIYSIK